MDPMPSQEDVAVAHLEDEVWTEEPFKVLHCVRRKLGKEPVTAVVAVDAVEFETPGGTSRLALLFDNRYAGGSILHKP